MHKISIIQGDEYRAKIETEIHKDTFFFDVYKRAMGCVTELIRHAEVHKQKEEQKGIQYRIGNNIIVFCGKRGQGKTSAMHSFSRILKHELEAEGIVCLDKRFYVLDAIDPSAMNKEESVVRVLISRLFNHVQQQDWEKKDAMEETEWKLYRHKLLEAFKTCYQNVDYIENMHRDDYGMDDLEHLSQLGSSSALRKTLGNLVDIFLDFASRIEGCKEKSDSYQYLIIQIDDMDMAMGNVFKICEDIRNYFSLPNVIVLMASDMKQLTREIEQVYLERSHELITVRSMEDRNYYIQKCNSMATRYSEKMFPAGHRIELPSLQDYMLKHHDSLKLEYYVGYALDRRNIFEGLIENDPDTVNMQQQLLRLLYCKTGMIFKSEPGKYHPVLPTTMRELTHFLKMLSDMEDVDLNCVGFPDKTQGDNQELQKLRDNLEIMQEYFFDFWCNNHLDEKIQEWFADHRETTSSGWDELLEKKGLYCSEKAEEAASDVILRTILWNKRFVDAVENGYAKDEMITYCKKCVEQWYTEEKRRYLGFHIMKFSYQYDLLKTKTSLESDREVAFYGQNETGAGTFDALNPIFHYFDNKSHSKQQTGSRINSVEEEDETVNSQNKFDLYGEMKWLFANIEVFQEVKSQISGYFARLERDRIAGNIRKEYENFYDCLDKWKQGDMFSCLGADRSEKGIGQYLMDHYNANVSIHFLNYCSNKENYQCYKDGLIKQSNNLKEQLQREVVNITESVEKSELRSLKKNLKYSDISEKVIEEWENNLESAESNKELTKMGESLYEEIRSLKEMLWLRQKVEEVGTDVRNDLKERAATGKKELTKSNRKKYEKELMGIEKMLKQMSRADEKKAEQPSSKLSEKTSQEPSEEKGSEQAVSETIEGNEEKPATSDLPDRKEVIQVSPTTSEDEEMQQVIPRQPDEQNA